MMKESLKEFRHLLFFSLPLGGKVAPKGPDEGAGFGHLVGREKVNCPAGAREAGLGHDLGAPLRFSTISRWGISPPAGGDLLCPWRQSRQNATGDASDGLRLRFAPPRPIGCFPRTPFYGSRQLGNRGSQRKGAGGSADRFPFYYRCR